MTTENKNAININLPLSVRELLMRDKQQQAVETLVNEWNCSEDIAKQCIASYREDIKQKHTALSIQVMQEREKNEQKQEKARKITIALRLVGGLIFIAALLLILKYTSAK